MNILVTGANGFIGSSLTKKLTDIGYIVTKSVRNRKLLDSKNNPKIVFGELTANFDWSKALDGIDIVIHLAARVHLMRDNSLDPLADFRIVNTNATLNLANQATLAGVSRFIFLSSVKVNGESSDFGKPITPNSPTLLDIYKSEAASNSQLIDPYGLSKNEAELAIKSLASKSEMDVVIIRPPLVYGPGVKGNLERLLNYLDKRAFLPIGRINNKRSLVSLENLNSLILECINNERAANQTFLVSDGEDLSTSELAVKLSQALGKDPRLLPIPHTILENVLKFLGKKNLADRLCGNLQLDITKTQSLLNWKPPLTVSEGLAECAKHFSSK